MADMDVDTPATSSNAKSGEKDSKKRFEVKKVLNDSLLVVSPNLSAIFLIS
jgi:hypothetical protein